MATLASAAIIQAVRDVLEDAHGSVRTIADGTYEPGPPEGASPRVQGSLSLGGPRVEVTIPEVSRHEASPPPQGSFQLLSVVVEIRVVRTFTLYEALNDASRAALKAAAAADADVIQQALGWPGNLTQTAAAASTGLVSGMLRHESSETEPIETEDDSDGRLVSVHRFNGVAKVELST